MEGLGYYQDGISAQQYACRVLLREGSLHLYFGEGASNVLIWDVSELASMQQNGESLNINYGAVPHQTLVCEGAVAMAIQEVWAARGKSRVARSLRRSRPFRLFILLIVGFLGLSLAGWFLFLPWVAEKAATLIPTEMEIEIGDRLAAVYTQEASTGKDSTTFLLQTFADRLKLSAKYPIKTEVLPSRDLNAFALPGGHIFVNAGIIKGMKSYEELVALLGHEVTHVEHRHSLKSSCRSAASSLVLAAVFGDLTGISSAIVSQAQQFKELDYSRDLETDADNYGLELMVKNQVSGRGMLNLLELLKREGQEMPQLMKYLSTHPDTEARIMNIASREQVLRRYSKNSDLDQLFKRLQKAVSGS